MTTGSKTLLVIVPGRDVYHDAQFNLLVAGTGEHLYSHICSNYTFAYNDLYGTRPERQEELKNRFGEVEIKYIDQTDITEDELKNRNEKWYQSLNINS